mgnify:CR=1 FL=1
MAGGEEIKATSLAPVSPLPKQPHDAPVVETVRKDTPNLDNQAEDTSSLGLSSDAIRDATQKAYAVAT